jgi:DNA-directed RNA polymerase specialized sigma24 family protein
VRFGVDLRDVQDVLQDAWASMLAAGRQPASFAADDACATYLWTTARARAVDRVRRGAVRRRGRTTVKVLIQPVSSESCEGRAAARLELERLETLFGPKRMRILALMASGCTGPEIGEALGVSRATAWRRSQEAADRARATGRPQ